MLRLGAPPSETREMDLDDIFIVRLKLMIIMAKSFLEGCPLGEYRLRAMLENAHHIETECVDELGILSSGPDRPTEARPVLSESDHVFYREARLLAAMVKAVAKGFPMDENRKVAMREHINQICQMMMFNSHSGDWAFLKVA